ncbi:MAG TPA: hypothetical protein VK449_04940 [Anaerolineales bacterium]|nr:hypothetical protein [Anaerolineales bacterium]
MKPFRGRPLRSRAWIVFPAVVLTALDGLLTLYRQPLAYWAGEFSASHEYSPLGHFFLALHPAAFAGMMLFWTLVVFLGGLLLEDPWGRIWALMIVIGHTTGSFDWLQSFNYFGGLTVFLAAAAMTVFSWRKADRLADRHRSLVGSYWR